MTRVSMMNHSAVRLFLVLTASAFLSSAALPGVVGSGTPSSCTGAALQAQIPAGGTITFNCGAGPQTITLTSTIVIVQTNPKVTIDGGDTITLDGNGMTSESAVLFGSATSLPDATFKHITFANGNITAGLGAGGKPRIWLRIPNLEPEGRIRAARPMFRVPL